MGKVVFMTFADKENERNRGRVLKRRHFSRTVISAGFLLLLALFYAGCAGAPQLPVNLGDPSAVPGPNESVVIVRRPNTNINALMNMSIFIDGATKLVLANNSEGRIIVPNGSHTISAELSADIASDPVRFDANSKQIVFTATPAVLYLVLYTFNSISLEKVGESDIAGAGQTSPGKGGAGKELENALYNAGNTLINTLPSGTTLAIINISSRDREVAEFVIEELAFMFVESGKFKIVDRKSLDAIRNEQNFQMSGEVDDNSAVSIGKLLGANVVITGNASGSASTRRLRLKALDVKTAEIVAMASEAF